MLSDIDIKILKYIYKNNKVHKYDILKKFPQEKYSTNLRLKEMEEEDFEIYAPFESSKYIISEYEIIQDINGINTWHKLDIYYLTDYGKKFIQDHCQNVKNIKKDFWIKFLLEFMRSVFCPLIVAFITTLLTLYGKKFFNIP